MIKETVSFPPFLEAMLTPECKLAFHWEIAAWQKDIMSSYFNETVNLTVIIIRVYDATDIFFNGSNAHSFYEFQLKEDKNHWVLKGLKHDRTYLTEIGYKLSQNQFFPILRSNLIHMSNNNQKNPIPSETHKSEEDRAKWLEKVSTYSYYENINEVK